MEDMIILITRLLLFVWLSIQKLKETAYIEPMFAGALLYKYKEKEKA